ILDAWSTATPFVACASEGPRATIRHGENGMLVAAENPPVLAGAVRAVLDNPGLRNRIAETGHAEYLAHFTREAVTRKMLETYETILNQTKAG
ncbi:MAG: glycosyltransferase, partial [Rhodospirillales bacterium]|nr:glycosyltransferase [Rhodospirillales bacterium]